MPRSRLACIANRSRSHPVCSGCKNWRSSCILTVTHQQFMASDLLTRIKQSPLLCDGAMGTLLYAQRRIHQSLLRRIESFPARPDSRHSPRLSAGWGRDHRNQYFRSKCLPPGAAQYRRQSARHQPRRRTLAREAAKSFDVWVAGSVGPLGTRIEPLGKTSFEEARRHFASRLRRWPKVASTC